MEFSRIHAHIKLEKRLKYINYHFTNETNSLHIYVMYVKVKINPRKKIIF